jgi:hypothetical protein
VIKMIPTAHRGITVGRPPTLSELIKVWNLILGYERCPNRNSSSLPEALRAVRNRGLVEDTEKLMDETALLKAAKILWESVVESAGSTLTWEEAQQEHRDLTIEHARRAIMTYLDSTKNGEHYIYPKGELLNADPFVIDDSFHQEFTAYSDDFPMFVEIKKD